MKSNLESAEKQMSTTKTDLWREYEREKAVLREQGVPPDEYAERIREIADRLCL